METLIIVEGILCVILLFINNLLKASNHAYAETLAQRGIWS